MDVTRHPGCTPESPSPLGPASLEAGPVHRARWSLLSTIQQRSQHARLSGEQRRIIVGFGALTEAHSDDGAEDGSAVAQRSTLSAHDGDRDDLLATPLGGRLRRAR